MKAADQASRLGRAPATTTAELSHIALDLFIANGFENTTIDDIVAAAGIGRRTFFRYFKSKNDLPWGDFDSLLEGMRAYLAEVPDDVPTVTALRTAVEKFNRFPPEEVGYHRQRMQLLLRAPALVAHSALRYAAWRQVVAEFAARRSGQAEGDLGPQAVGWTFLASSMAAYEQWLKDTDADLPTLLHDTFDLLVHTFADPARQ